MEVKFQLKGRYAPPPANNNLNPLNQLEEEGGGGGDTPEIPTRETLRNKIRAFSHISNFKAHNRPKIYKVIWLEITYSIFGKTLLVWSIMNSHTFRVHL